MKHTIKQSNRVFLARSSLLTENDLNVKSSTLQQPKNTSPISKVFDRVNYEHRSASSSQEFKLDTIRLILARLNDPQDSLNIVHIAGTKGKGSTAAFVSRLGSELGLKTAVYSSPHFESYCERFTIDNRMVSEELLNPVLQRVLNVVEQLDSEIQAKTQTCRPATFFDISTAAALLLFAEQQAELVVLEVGLGGRLDSTNICDPLVTLITSISLDHTKQLGNTAVEIASEKAAIIKSPVPAICGSVSDEVFAVIEEQARVHSARLFRCQRDFLFDCHVAQNPRPDTQPTSVHLAPPDHALSSQTAESKHDTPSNGAPSSGASSSGAPSSGAPALGTTMFNYSDPGSGYHFQGLKIDGLGQHQCHNAALAIKAVAEILPRLPVNAEVLNAELQFEQVVGRALAKTQLKGRLEVISRNPLLIADMAHNQASIGAMLSCFRDLQIPGKKQAIFSCSNDKDHSKMLDQLIGYFDRLFLTEFQSNPRAQTRKQLAQTSAEMIESSENSVELVSHLSPAESLERALADSDDYGLTVVCGSIFLVGEMLPILEQYRDRP